MAKFSVSIYVDSKLEGNETLTLAINDSLPKRVSRGNPNQAIITIIDTSKYLVLTAQKYYYNFSFYHNLHAINIQF